MKHTNFLKSLKVLKSHLENISKKRHTIPSLNNTKHNNLYCNCLDSQGQNKYLYKSQEELAYILASKSTRLKSYPCPFEQGWHLTKSI